MPLQDLTPQLRTRLSRVERTVGWFITIATLLLLTAFGYYLYHTAKRKGWFETKVPYTTSINNAAGLKVGDPVRLMGFPVGDITGITPNSPEDEYGVTIEFRIKPDFYGYIWLDSRVRVTSDFLGNRYLEILKGYDGAPTVLETGNKELLVLRKNAVNRQLTALKKQITEANPDLSARTIEAEANNDLNKFIQTNQSAFYTNVFHTEPYWIPPQETPALNDRLEALVGAVEAALPNILKLTNQVAAALTNASGATTELRTTVAAAQPMLSNLTAITSNLKDPNGSLGNWLLPTNLNMQLEKTLSSANSTLTAAHSTIDNTDTNITALVNNLNKTLEELAGLTSNLNNQVESNTNLLKGISDAVVHTDELVQGLKHHWLLRSAFKKKPAEKKN